MNKIIFPRVRRHLLRRYLWAFAFSALTATAVQAEVTVIDVRTGVHPDKTRVVLELSEVAYYQISYLNDATDKNLREIIIDLQETPSRERVMALSKKASTIGVVHKVTFEDHEGSVRLRISLRKAATVDKGFTLRPDHGLQYRLVFDLKAVSAAEWARQVKLTSSILEQASPLPEVPARPEPPISIDAPTPPKAPAKLTGASSHVEEVEGPSYGPQEAGPELLELQEAETSENYDEMMTDDSNFTLSGYVEVEARGFVQSSPRMGPKDWTVSFALEPLLEYVSQSSSSQFMFRPFGRVDVNDRDRSHFDIRELKWTGTLDSWQVTVGIDTVFWGVTESAHLVDILNQDDNLEDIDQEDKLGQPMATVSYDSEFGVFSAYLMTYFRELRYPGSKGRFSLPLPVDYTQTQYEAASDKWHTDWAVRWAHVIGNVDVGLYHFRGTNREPELVMGMDLGGNPVLIPRYNLINQTGLDLQATFDDFLIKFEAVRRAGTGQDFWAMAGGMEYTFYGIGGGDSDIGVLTEYLYDDRGNGATTPFEDDLFMGVRWAANDMDSTEVLVGAIFDLDTSAKFVNFEGSRRIGDNWKVTFDARFFLGVPMTDPIFPQSRDDFFQIRLARYF
ncbi:MAG: hypothetical protein JKY45_09030 [Emcibacter sp.]|nr:hypothetical protein [Emcibacter sp.]